MNTNDWTPEREEIPGQEDENLNNVNPLSLEEQEQVNSTNLSQRINEEDAASNDYGDADELTSQASQGEEDLENFTTRELPGSEAAVDADDRPVTRNQLGDNPPGAERQAFENGQLGDTDKESATFISDNIVENFRENLDRTKENIELDKRLKEQGDESSGTL
jgi:hypothetical protein